MLGKILGAGAVSFFQFVIWGVSARVLLSLRGPIARALGADPAAIQTMSLPRIPAATLAAFVAFFLGGFLLLESGTHERSPLDVRADALARAVHDPNRDASEMDSGQHADVGAGNVAGDTRDCDRGRDVGRRADLSSGDTHDRKAAEFEGTGEMGADGLDAERPRRLAGTRLELKA